MPNPKASATTQSYRRTIKSTSPSGGPTITTTNYSSVRTPAQIGSGGGSSSKSSVMGGSVELFLVGSFFIWVIVSGKLTAIISAAKS